MAWYQFAYLIFFLICALLVVGKLRWSFVILLVAVNIDVTAPGSNIQYASILNAVRIALPIIVLIRLSINKTFKLYTLKNNYLLVYGIFALYVMIAIIWSPFKIGGIKAIFYLIGYFIWIFTFYNLFMNRLISVHKILLLYFLVVGIAIIQSFVFSNPFGVREYSDVMRFTSFSPPQRFGAFILVLTSFILFFYENKFRYIFLILSFIIIYNNGSRYVFVAFILMSIIYFMFELQKKDKNIRSVHKIFIISIGFFFFVSIGVTIFSTNDSDGGRLNELTQSGFNPSEVGTFIWRLRIYNQALSNISDRNAVTLLLGRGTSSSAEVGLAVESRYKPDTIDENRIMHNEVLRSLYEWGIIGLFLFLYLITIIIIYPIKLLFQNNVIKNRNGYFLISCLFLIIIGLMIENLLSGSGTPSGSIISLLLAYMLTINKIKIRKVLY